MLRVFISGLALFAATALSVAPASADDWIKVESAQEGFVVEMPARPTYSYGRTFKNAGANVKIGTNGCTTPGGLYYLQIVVLPGPIVKGTEDGELEAERDDWARQYNGKVIDEKKIKLDNRVGREFTIRGKTDNEDSVVNVRVRQFMSEDSIHILVVVAPPNRGLPEDATRFFDSLKILGKGIEVASNPDKTTPNKVPNGRVRPDRASPEFMGVNLSGWGLALDPQKDCNFLADGARLSMTIKGSRHQGANDRGQNTPRVMREVEGDFSATVKILGEFPAAGPSSTPRFIPFNGAGLILWNDAENYIRLERAAANRNGKVNAYINFELFRTGAAAMNNSSSPMLAGDCWVRMERKGNKILASSSFDEKTWKELKSFEVDWPQKLKLGVQATTSSSQLPWTVKFEDYEVKTEKAR